jgi:hypothetical protein
MKSELGERRNRVAVGAGRGAGAKVVTTIGSSAQGRLLQLVHSASDSAKVERPFRGDPLMVSSSSRAETASGVARRVKLLVKAVGEGRIIDAVDEFYASDVELGRGALAPLFGLETRAGRSWAAANADAEWSKFRVHGVGVNGDTSFIECALTFVSQHAQPLTMHQVAVAQWRDGKIVKECLIPKR